MASIDELIARIRWTPGCNLEPATGLPTPLPERGHILPDDVRRFYDICGGAEFHSTSDYPMVIVDPHEVQPANLILMDELYDDISSSWYRIATLGIVATEMITIDLSKQRLGWCYCSFDGQHAEPGDCPIVAKSFTELVERLLDEEGRYLFWWEDGFESMGDAYDGITPGPRHPFFRQR